MHQLNRPTVAGSVILAFAFLMTVTANAQINAAPPSVTSQGFGGRAFNGAPPSVTSLGPRGYTPSYNPAFPNSHPTMGSAAPTPPANTHHHEHHDHDHWVGVYGVPYYYGDYGYYDNGDPSANASQAQTGGPTIFDRNGTGYVGAAPAPHAYRDPAPADPAAEDPSVAADQPETVLVFKDGHQLEIGNYAIVGSTLYDLSDGHHRKVALADLDLNATVKENDNRGVDFALPSGVEAN